MYEVLQNEERFVVNIIFNIKIYLIITTNAILLCYEFRSANIEGRPVKEVSLYFNETHWTTSNRLTAFEILVAV